MSKQLTVCGMTIKQDAEGRYCLNDLHKAAGGEAKHTPGRFTCTESFQGLCEELSRNQDKSPFTSGRGVGTFVVKELVYAYAMWVSPKFHLEVIRSYDRLATEGVAVHASAAESVLEDPLTYMEKVIAQARVLKAERDRLALENKEMAPKAIVFDNCVALRQESLATFVRSFGE